ncbi:hypothetical protein B0H14DRAFT_2607873 [Mycena olivaceomarginata]|nr:hypothetical protein B0H14DRAFT_2607873 [Mycena olivaceomarginata]
MPPRSPTQSRPSPRKGKTKVNFGANSSSQKCKARPDANSDTGPSSSTKRARKDGTSGSESAGTSTSTGHTNMGGAGSSDMLGSAANAAANNVSTKTTSAKMQARDHWGIHPKEVPADAGATQVF